MSKKTLRLITIISTIVLVICSCTMCFADGFENINPNRPEGGEIVDVGNKVMGFIQTLGMIISVAVLMILGIKYMMGSAEEKAEYKKVFIPYIVGAILLFAATTIAKAIYNAVNGFNG